MARVKHKHLNMLHAIEACGSPGAIYRTFSAGRKIAHSSCPLKSGQEPALQTLKAWQSAFSLRANLVVLIREHSESRGFSCPCLALPHQNPKELMPKTVSQKRCLHLRTPPNQKELFPKWPPTGIKRWQMVADHPIRVTNTHMYMYKVTT